MGTNLFAADHLVESHKDFLRAFEVAVCLIRSASSVEARCGCKLVVRSFQSHRTLLSESVEQHLKTCFAVCASETGNVELLDLGIVALTWHHAVKELLWQANSLASSAVDHLDGFLRFPGDLFYRDEPGDMLRIAKKVRLNTDHYWPAIAKNLQKTALTNFDYQRVRKGLQREFLRMRQQTQRTTRKQDTTRHATGKRRDQAANDLLILAALCEHHRYDAGGAGSVACPVSIGVRELRKKMNQKLSQATISEWFRRHFGNHRHYVVCCNNGKIASELHSRNGSYSPRELRQQLAEQVTEIAARPIRADEL